MGPSLSLNFSSLQTPSPETHPFRASAGLLIDTFTYPRFRMLPLCRNRFPPLPRMLCFILDAVGSTTDEDNQDSSPNPMLCPDEYRRSLPIGDSLQDHEMHAMVRRADERRGQSHIASSGHA